MRTKTLFSKAPSEQVVKDIRRATRKHYSAEDKIRIVLEGLRGEDSFAAVKALHKASITLGRRSFWKPGNSGWLALYCAGQTDTEWVS